MLYVYWGGYVTISTRWLHRMLGNQSSIGEQKRKLLWGSELRTKWARGEVSFCDVYGFRFLVRFGSSGLLANQMILTLSYGCIPWFHSSIGEQKRKLLWGSELRTKWARGEVSFCDIYGFRFLVRFGSSGLLANQMILTLSYGCIPWFHSSIGEQKRKLLWGSELRTKWARGEVSFCDVYGFRFLVRFGSSGLLANQMILTLSYGCIPWFHSSIGEQKRKLLWGSELRTKWARGEVSFCDIYGFRFLVRFGSSGLLANQMILTLSYGCIPWFHSSIGEQKRKLLWGSELRTKWARGEVSFCDIYGFRFLVRFGSSGLLANQMILTLSYGCIPWFHSSIGEQKRKLLWGSELRTKWARGEVSFCDVYGFRFLVRFGSSGLLANQMILTLSYGCIPWFHSSIGEQKRKLLWGSELRTKWARGEVSFCDIYGFRFLVRFGSSGLLANQMILTLSYGCNPWFHSSIGEQKQKLLWGSELRTKWARGEVSFCDIYGFQMLVHPPQKAQDVTRPWICLSNSMINVSVAEVHGSGLGFTCKK